MEVDGICYWRLSTKGWVELSSGNIEDSTTYPDSVYSVPRVIYDSSSNTFRVFVIQYNTIAASTGEEAWRFLGIWSENATTTAYLGRLLEFTITPTSGGATVTNSAITGLVTQSYDVSRDGLSVCAANLSNLTNVSYYHRADTSSAWNIVNLSYSNTLLDARVKNGDGGSVALLLWNSTASPDQLEVQIRRDLRNTPSISNRTVNSVYGQAPVATLFKTYNDDAVMVSYPGSLDPSQTQMEEDEDNKCVTTCVAWSSAATTQWLYEGFVPLTNELLWEDTAGSGRVFLATTPSALIGGPNPQVMLMQRAALADDPFPVATVDVDQYDLTHVGAYYPRNGFYDSANINGEVFGGLHWPLVLGDPIYPTPRVGEFSNTFYEYWAKVGPPARLSFRTNSGGKLSAVEYDKKLYFSTGEVFDGSRLLPPNVGGPRITGWEGNGGAGTAVTRRYRVTADWYDAQGQLHRTTPSPLDSEWTTVTSNDGSVDLYIELPQWLRGRGRIQSGELAEYPQRDVFISLWATESGDENGAGVGLDFISSFKVSSAGTLSIRANQNAVLDGLGTEILREGSAQLVQVKPPPFLDIIEARDRLWGIQGNKVWYSTKSFNEPAKWLVSGYVRTPEEVTGIAGMDDNVVVFNRRGIRLVGGEGPDDSGLGRDFTTSTIVSETGCLDHRSVIETRQGVFFMSERTLELLPRGQGEPVPFGDKFRDTIAQYPFCIGATTIPAMRSTFFSFSDSPQTTGLGLIIEVSESGNVFKWTTRKTGVPVVFKYGDELGFVLSRQTGAGVYRFADRVDNLEADDALSFNSFESSFRTNWIRTGVNNHMEVQGLKMLMSNPETITNFGSGIADNELIVTQYFRPEDQGVPSSTQTFDLTAASVKGGQDESGEDYDWEPDIMTERTSANAVQFLVRLTGPNDMRFHGMTLEYTAANVRNPSGPEDNRG